jgi:hypothetical protein
MLAQATLLPVAPIPRALLLLQAQQRLAAQPMRRGLRTRQAARRWPAQQESPPELARLASKSSSNFQLGIGLMRGREPVSANREAVHRMSRMLRSSSYKRLR